MQHRETTDAHKRAKKKPGTEVIMSRAICIRGLHHAVQSLIL